MRSLYTYPRHTRVADPLVEVRHQFGLFYHWKLTEVCHISLQVIVALAVPGGAAARELHQFS